MHDPFMDDHKTVNGSLDDQDPNLNIALHEKFDSLAYHQNRFTAGQSPICLFIPRKEIMLKLMRACIYVAQPNNLWF